jgi:gliding motility-associated-like protein
VRVKPLPQVAIANNDTVVRYGAQIQLQGSGAERYVWSPSRGLSDAYIANPVVNPERPAVYVLTGITDGCFAYDSVRVDVDFRGHLLIPSAFTPNGDGRNDVFRVANLSFQKLVEFRVLNRWGKEVFRSEEGGAQEWDGTWNGVPQPMDTYYYIIRIGYPDGIMDTHTGDITLVR